MTQENPFNEGTNSYEDYEILKDLKWHCSKCELKSGQAKTWQIWRDEHGFQFEKGNPESRNWDKRIRCDRCSKTTVHRKLRTLERLGSTSVRAGVSSSVAKRVKRLYEYREAFSLRKTAPKDLEIDHRFPQIRWNEDESRNEGLSDEELKEKFILLTRKDNLLKSRNCERCVKTGRRGNFPGINYWYEGGEHWVGDPHDENGCVGCFWHDPFTWRDRLNNLTSAS
ncbi:MAG: hypothetical protein R2747_22760 [Pyrinomonadaceae bacterium]